jgi:DNA-directed RNA polymerase specialized sigma24 family protein
MLDRERTSALVRLGQAGDADAFAELVRAYQDLAVAYATSILGDYQLAEDVAQESFVEAYRALTALREPAAFGAWFRRIVFKHCDRLTRRKRPHGAYPNPPVESSADAVGIAIARGQSVHCCHAWTQAAGAGRPAHRNSRERHR